MPSNRVLQADSTSGLPRSTSRHFFLPWLEVDVKLTMNSFRREDEAVELPLWLRRPRSTLNNDGAGRL